MPQYLKCLATVLCAYHLFSDVNISQGSVSIHLMHGGIFSYLFTASLSLSLTVKEFWKSFKIWHSNRGEFCSLLFGTQCTNHSWHHRSGHSRVEWTNQPHSVKFCHLQSAAVWSFDCQIVINLSSVQYNALWMSMEECYSSTRCSHRGETMLLCNSDDANYDGDDDYGDVLAYYGCVLPEACLHCTTAWHFLQESGLKMLVTTR